MNRFIEFLTGTSARFELAADRAAGRVLGIGYRRQNRAAHRMLADLLSGPLSRSRRYVAAMPSAITVLT